MLKTSLLGTKEVQNTELAEENRPIKKDFLSRVSHARMIQQMRVKDLPKQQHCDIVSRKFKNFMNELKQTNDCVPDQNEMPLSRDESSLSSKTSGSISQKSEHYPCNDSIMDKIIMT